jgi:hypothetical protein
MGDMEEVPGVHGAVKNNACPNPSPGEMKRGIFQDPLAISRAFLPSVCPAYSKNYRISQNPRNLKAQ